MGLYLISNDYVIRKHNNTLVSPDLLITRIDRNRQHNEESLWHKSYRSNKTNPMITHISNYTDECETFHRIPLRTWNEIKKHNAKIAPVKDRVLVHYDFNESGTKMAVIGGRTLFEFILREVIDNTRRVEFISKHKNHAFLVDTDNKYTIVAETMSNNDFYTILYNENEDTSYSTNITYLSGLNLHLSNTDLKLLRSIFDVDESIWKQIKTYGDMFKLCGYARSYFKNTLITFSCNNLPSYLPSITISTCIMSTIQMPLYKRLVDKSKEMLGIFYTFSTVHVVSLSSASSPFESKYYLKIQMNMSSIATVENQKNVVTDLSPILNILKLNNIAIETIDIGYINND